MSVDVYDENGVGGGASGVSGGLLHPYSPKGLLHRYKHSTLCSTQFCSLIVLYSFESSSSISLIDTWISCLTAAKLLWRGGEFWKESMDLLRSAEKADGTAGSDGAGRDDEALIWRRQSVFPCS